MRGTRRLLLAAALACTTVAAGCSTDPAGSSSDTIVVFAASSLTEAFTAVGTAFEAAHPGAHVTFNFASSSELAAQIGEGAPADVFASADQKNMDKVLDTGANASDPVVFATNSMSIIVAAGNPKGIASLADLADPDLVVVLCADEVPCGTYAARVIDTAGVAITPKSLEQNAKAAVSKVIAGEADAAIVFNTDAVAASTSATGIDIPADIDVVAEYPIVTLAGSTNGTMARDFVDFVISAAGLAILKAHGFGAP